ncbi:hypothetical protein D3C73_704440 [compost metagenome]
MSLKSIDLQFALHKNDEAGFKQNQLSHKPQQDQAVLENQASSLTEKDRGRSHKVGESSSTGIQHENNNKDKQQRKGKLASKKVQTSSSATKHADHPFKGQHIDFSL